MTIEGCVDDVVEGFFYSLLQEDHSTSTVASSTQDKDRFHGG
jgi:hypothetical protein